MDKHNIGILHPGEMGVSIAATMKNTGHDVYWMSDGRSDATRARAEKVGLLDAGTLAKLCATCEVIVSVCPPGAAEDIAKEVLSQGFKGVFVDANAISPQRAKHISSLISDAGGTFVDGGIIGGPAWKPGTTWLYLSGDTAEEAASYFAAGPLETCVIGDEIGKASALKMCFAAYTKGSTALLSGVMAAAEALGVRDELAQQWSRDKANSAEENARRVQQVTAKAWRFEGEMVEIAATFEEAGLPDGFHQAAADIYRRMAGFKDASTVPSLEDVLNALLQQDNL